MLAQVKFHHRQNKYGGHDSICSACLMTVAWVEFEWELVPLESAHVCNSESLYWMLQGRAVASDCTSIEEPDRIMHDS